MKVICYNVCGKVTNFGEFREKPPCISMDRGSNMMVPGPNRMNKDLCEGCFERIWDWIEGLKEKQT